MDFIRPSLTRSEAEITRQAFDFSINRLFETCFKCKSVGGNGCRVHGADINTLRLLRQRFNFRHIDAPTAVPERTPSWCRG